MPQKAAYLEAICTILVFFESALKIIIMIFRKESRVVDTWVEEVKIDRNRELHVAIHLDLLKILDQDAGLENLSSAASSKRVETYTRIPDMYPAGQIRLRL
jgi:hypothetical protein